jgi:hypothetical protein
MALLGAGLLAAAGGCTPLFLGHAPIPIPVPPWTAERMEEKYCDRLQHRTPIMPPILPGQPRPECVDPPSEEEIIRMLPHVTRGVPYIYEEFRDIEAIVVERLVDEIDPCVFVPLIGPAQLHHCHYKCTVFYRQRIQSNYPFPFYCENDKVEVVYIDKDHFHLCVGPDEKTQRVIFRETAGP